MSFSYFTTTGDFNNKDILAYQLKNMDCDGTVELEDRLKIYLRKKKYYKKHGLKPCVTPEEEFQVTKKDIALIKAYIEIRRNIRTKKYDEPQIYFPSSMMKEDRRAPKIKREKYQLPPNMGMFVPDDDTTYYEGPITKTGILDKRDFPPRDVSLPTGYNIDNTRFDPRTDPIMCANQCSSRLPRANFDPCNGCKQPTADYRVIPKNCGIKKYNKNNSQYNVLPNQIKETEKLDQRNRYIITYITNKNT